MATLVDLDLGRPRRRRRGDLPLAPRRAHAAGRRLHGARQEPAPAARQAPRPDRRRDALSPPRARPDRQRGDARDVRDRAPRSSARCAATSTTRASSRSRPRCCSRCTAARWHGRSSRTTTSWTATSTCGSRPSSTSSAASSAASSASTSSARTSATRASRSSTTPSSRWSSGTRPTRTTRTRWCASSRWSRRSPRRAATRASSTSARRGGASRCATRSPSTPAGSTSSPTATRAAWRRRSARPGWQGYETDGRTWPQLVDDLVSKAVEPNVTDPVFVTDYPKEISPFAKDARSGDDDLVERFEAFCSGMEIANAFTELNDPDEQRRALRAAGAARDRGGRRGAAVRRGVRRGAGAGHAADGRGRARHRPPRDADDRKAVDPRDRPLPGDARLSASAPARRKPRSEREPRGSTGGDWPKGPSPPLIDWPMPSSQTRSLIRKAVRAEN